MAWWRLLVREIFPFLWWHRRSWRSCKGCQQCSERVEGEMRFSESSVSSHCCKGLMDGIVFIYYKFIKCATVKANNDSQDSKDQTSSPYTATPESSYCLHLQCDVESNDCSRAWQRMLNTSDAIDRFTFGCLEKKTSPYATDREFQHMLYWSYISTTAYVVDSTLIILYYALCIMWRWLLIVQYSFLYDKITIKLNK